MKAIVLAAGVGRRLAELTSERPKCLIPVGGRPILAWMLDALRPLPLEGVVLVVGYRADMIRAEIAAAGAASTVTFVENPRYEEGAVLSLHAAREHLASDVMVMDADVLFDPSILADLVLRALPSSFLCDTDHAFTGEEMMLHGALDHVTGIHRGVRPGEPVLGEAVGFLKLRGDDARFLRDLLQAAVDAGRTSIEHEEVYNDLLARRTVAAMPTAGRAWTEIDFVQDVRRAELEVLPALRRS